MKFSSHGFGQVSLSVVFCVLVSSCNKEEFYKAEEFLIGEDAYCFEQGPDLASCLQLPDRCQPAFMESQDEESQEPEFFACLSNPNYQPPGSTTGGTEGGSTTGGTEGGSDAGGVDGGSSTGGTEGGSDAGGTDGGSAAGGTDGGSAAGGTDGGSAAGGTDGGSVAGGTDGGSNPVEPPSIQDTIAAKCKNLDAKYLWTKKIVKKDSVSYESKVKVCHNTGNGSSHTIVIACPALNAHKKHHDDSIGVCLE